MYLIDTNIVKEVYNEKKEVLQRFIKYEEDIAFCSVVVSECIYGARKNNSQKLISFYTDFFAQYPVYSYDYKSSFIFAELKDGLIKAGQGIGDFDTMIASVALANNLTLVTNNTKHFERIEGLRLENWID